MGAFVATVVSVAVGVAASVAGNQSLVFLSAVAAIGAAYWQYRDSIPYEQLFDEYDWQGDTRDFQIYIPPARHRKPRPTTVVLRKDGEEYREVMCGITTEQDGGVRVSANLRFVGKVLVR